MRGGGHIRRLQRVRQLRRERRGRGRRAVGGGGGSCREAVRRPATPFARAPPLPLLEAPSRVVGSISRGEVTRAAGSGVMGTSRGTSFTPASASAAGVSTGSASRIRGDVLTQAA